jgi:hypothetical protein
MGLDSLETVLSLLKQMEANLLALKELREYVGNGVGKEMLEVLIEENETQLAEIKRKLIH